MKDKTFVLLFSIGGLVGIIGGMVSDEPLYVVCGILWFILAKLYDGITINKKA